MNSILQQYFDRIKNMSKDGGVEYFVYDRGTSSSMPYSVHLRSTDCEELQRNSWGTGKTKDEAFGKALMEMIERMYFSVFSPFEFSNVFGLLKRKKSLFDLSQYYDISLGHLHPANTNGIAIHLSKNKAIQSALLELIERHTILYAITMGIGPDSRVSKTIAPTKECRFYIWKSPLNTFTVVGAITDDVGSYYSSGCDYKLDIAIRKAEDELNSFLFLNEEKVNDSEIVKDDIQSFNRYHKFSGDKRAFEFLEKACAGSIPNLDKKDFFYSDIPMPTIFSGLHPLPCVRVIHPNVQQLFFDNWDEKYLNPRIFRSGQSLPAFPHIIA